MATDTPDISIEDFSAELADISSAKSLMLLLHRHTDGWITSSAGDDEGNVIPKHSIRACDLESKFPEIASLYLKDAYVSINASWWAKQKRGSPIGYPVHNTG